jgi:hypothetical protein
VINTLKDAFVHGRLTKDELDTRAGQALAARTYADLAALIADIPPAPAAGPARPPAPARDRPLARAAAKWGSFLIITAATIWAAFLSDPDGPGPHAHHLWAAKMLVLAYLAALAALGLFWYRADISREQSRSRGQPPRRGPVGHALEGEWRGGTGHDPAPPGPRTDPARAGLRAHQPRQHRQHIPVRAGRAPRGVRPVPGTG